MIVVCMAQITRCFSLTFLCTCFLACGESGGNAAPIHVRLLGDLSGARSDVGAAYHAGRIDRLREINRHGGIAGSFPIEHETADTRGDAATAVQAYLSFKASLAWSDVVTVFGHDAESTLSLLDKINTARLPFVSQSLDASLSAPTPLVQTYTDAEGQTQQATAPGAPHNFFMGLDDSSSVRAALDFVAWSGGRRIAFSYCTSRRYCRGPLEPAKSYARWRLGLDLAPDLVIEPGWDNSAIASVVGPYLDTAGADWIWLSHPRGTCAAILRVAGNSTARFVVSSSGIDEGFDADTEGAARGRVYGLVHATPFGAMLGVPAMLDLVEAHDRYRSTAPMGNVHYVMGYASVVVWEIALERLVASGDVITRDSIKSSLEALRGVHTGGLLPPLTYRAEDHRPTTQVDIYGIDTDGKFAFQTTAETERRKDWLGW